MEVNVELNIPPHFFDSANESNNYESVSERISKQILTTILGGENIRRGDAEAFEPDYVSGDSGYEVTFAIENSLIPQLKGVRPLSFSNRNIEHELIKDITNAVNRKAAKKYSCPTSVVVISIETLITWYTSFKSEENNFEARILKLIYEKGYLRNRNEFFKYLADEYIEKGMFKDIYILQPTHNGEFALYDILQYRDNPQDFISYIGVSHPEAFPTYKVISVDNEDLNKAITYKTTIINWK